MFIVARLFGWLRRLIEQAADAQWVARVERQQAADDVLGEAAPVHFQEALNNAAAGLVKGLIGGAGVGKLSIFASGGEISGAIDGLDAELVSVAIMAAGQAEIAFGQGQVAEEFVGGGKIVAFGQQPADFVASDFQLAGRDHLFDFFEIFLAGTLPGGLAELPSRRCRLGRGAVSSRDARCETHRGVVSLESRGEYNGA